MGPTLWVLGGRKEEGVNNCIGVGEKRLYMDNLCRKIQLPAKVFWRQFCFSLSFSGNEARVLAINLTKVRGVATTRTLAPNIH